MNFAFSIPDEFRWWAIWQKPSGLWCVSLEPRSGGRLQNGDHHDLQAAIDMAVSGTYTRPKVSLTPAADNRPVPQRYVKPSLLPKVEIDL